MPKKRVKNKAHLSGYIDRRLLARLRRAAARVGMQDDVFGYAALLIEVALPPAPRKTHQKRPPPSDL